LFRYLTGRNSSGASSKAKDETPEGVAGEGKVNENLV